MTGSAIGELQALDWRSADYCPNSGERDVVEAAFARQAAVVSA